MKKLLLILAIVAITAPAALAQSPAPPFGTKSGPATKPVKPIQANHGLLISIRLNAAIFDGEDAAFSLRVENAGNSAIRYTAVAVGWSFDGQKPGGFAELNDLPGGTVFTDLDRHWIKSGTLPQGGVFSLQGKVRVADRSDFPAKAGRDATFFCITVAVRGSYPGKPNAKWYELSKPDCRQYSVK